jgi:hypothetical protein
MANFGLPALLLASSFLQAVFAANCSIQPIYNDIHKRAVHGSAIFQYGSFIGVGNPTQNQSIFPSLRLNETSFAASTFCQNSNLTNCIDSTGGSVDLNQSSTYVPSTHDLNISLLIRSSDGSRTQNIARKTSKALSLMLSMARMTSTFSHISSRRILHLGHRSQLPLWNMG